LKAKASAERLLNLYLFERNYSFELFNHLKAIVKLFIYLKAILFKMQLFTNDAFSSFFNCRSLYFDSFILILVLCLFAFSALAFNLSPVSTACRFQDGRSTILREVDFL